MMSANSTAASTSCRRTGCSVTSAQSSGVPATLEEPVTLADRAVLRQRAARLAHEPHRGALDGLAAQRTNEKRLGHAPRLAPRWSASASIPSRPARSRCAGSRTSWRRPRAGARGRGARRASRTRAPRPGAPRAGRGRAALVPLARPAREPGRLGRRPHAVCRSPVAPGRADRADRAARWRRARPAATGSRSTSSRSTASGSSELGCDAARRRRRGAPRIDERRLAVVVHGGDDPETSAALAAQEEPVATDEPAAVAHLVAGAAPRPTGRAGCSTRTRRAGRRSGPASRPRTLGAPPAISPRGSPAAGATPASACRSCSRRCSPASSRASTRGCPPTTARTRSSTGGSWSDFDRDPVVDAPEHERAERERDDRRHAEVDASAERRRLAEEERRPDRLDRRRERVSPVDQVDEPGVRLGARHVLERIEDRRQEEPGQEQRRDDVLDVAEDRVRGRDRERDAADEERRRRRRPGSRARPCRARPARRRARGRARSRA